MYNENYKTLLKQLKKTQINGNTCHVNGLKDLIYVIITQSDLQIQRNFYQNSNDFFAEIKKKIILKFTWNLKGIWTEKKKKSLEKEEESWKSHISISIRFTKIQQSKCCDTIDTTSGLESPEMNPYAYNQMMGAKTTPWGKKCSLINAARKIGYPRAK